MTSLPGTAEDVPGIIIDLFQRLSDEANHAYLTERCADGASLLRFYHRQLGEVVTGEFLAGGAKRERHIALGSFFAGQDYFLETLEAQQERARKLPPKARPANLRKASELAWQLLRAERWEQLEGLLTDLFFLETKIEGGMVFDLASDFSAAVKAIQCAGRHYQ